MKKGNWNGRPDSGGGSGGSFAGDVTATARDRTSAAIEHKVTSAINADLSVSLHRPLDGEWVGLDSVSVYEPSGVGLADTRLYDVRGPIGRAVQSLIVEARN